MSFTVPSIFGERRFETLNEYVNARKETERLEKELASREETYDKIAKVTAIVVPAPQELVNQRVIELEKKIDQLNEFINALQLGKTEEAPTENKDGIQTGTILRGESKGKSYTLQVLSEGYLCSDGIIYDTLSAAALGVSGNRRSGWKFWKNVEGRSIGEIIGRFKPDAKDNPFATG